MLLLILFFIMLLFLIRFLYLLTISASCPTLCTNMSTETHILRTDHGYTASITLTDKPSFSVEWSPDFPPPDIARQITAQYLTWRDGILKDWAKRTGKKVTIITT